MSRQLVNPISDLFDVACRYHTVQVSCQCGNVGVFDPHALWYPFERKGWNDRLHEQIDCAGDGFAVLDAGDPWH